MGLKADNTVFKDAIKSPIKITDQKLVKAEDYFIGNRNDSN